MTPTLNAFDNAKYVVTHPGQAHRDETLAVAFVLGLNPRLPVFRRDPTADELADPGVVVVDVGQKFDTQFNNYDHHQFPRDFEPTSSLTLILERAGLLTAAKRAFVWLEFTDLLDSRGPVAAAKFLGTSVDKFQVTLSPIEATVLRMFERTERDGLFPGNAVHDLLRDMGLEKIGYVKRFADRMVKLEQNAKVEVLAADDGRLLEVVDARFVDRKDDPLLALEAWTKENYPAAAVTVTQDDRGDGVTVFRRNDHPRIDFSALDGKVGTVFAHKNGFVAKLAPGFDPLVAIRQSIRPA